MKKLPISERVFWLNFFQCIGIISLSILLLSFYPDLSILESYLFVSFVGLIVLSGKVAMQFKRHEDIDELARRMNFTPGEFREKYREILSNLK